MIRPIRVSVHAVANTWLTRQTHVDSFTALEIATLSRPPRTTATSSTAAAVATAKAETAQWQ